MSLVISPSLLSCDFANIELELRPFHGMENIWIHLDIMDGHFVSNLTFGVPVVKRICEVTGQRSDAHLMVTNPEFHIEKMKGFGLHNITFHYEARPVETRALILQAKKNYPSVGVSIRPKTAVSQLSDEVLEAVDLVLIMSVNPGFGGQSFLPSTLEKITTLKGRRNELGTRLDIQVDGGINQETAGQALAMGADNLVVGSYIFNGSRDSYRERVKSLQRMARKETKNP